MHKIRAALVGLLCLVAVGGCTTNNTIANTNFTTSVTMKLAVGTINDTAGQLDFMATGAGGPGVFLDAISVFRNQLGNSPFIHPGAAELTPATVGTCNFTTGVGCNIGDSPETGVGLFSYGQQPGVNGTNAAASAWLAPGSGTGYLFDLQVGDLPPRGVGGTTYTLTDKLFVNGQQQSYTASATLNAVPTILGAPANAVYTPTAGTGGGTVTCGVFPAGATEQVVMFLSGPFTVAAAAECVAPSTSGAIALGTLKVGAYTCFVVAADFPWVEAGVTNAPATGNPNPTIVGANGNADLSAGGTYGPANCTQT